MSEYNLLIGIGNIGKQYEDTRHNVGFRIIDQIVKEYLSDNVSYKSKYNAQYQIIDGLDNKIILVKPSTYVNRSGIAAMEFKNFYKVKLENIFVFHDDLDVKIGKIRIKIGGSDGGHNGLKSLDSHIGKNYHRVRIGISHPRDINPHISVSDYVLSKFLPEENSLVDNISVLLAKNLKLLLNHQNDILIQKLNLMPV